ncbi:MAG: site-specific integrase [Bacteroidales bacterium]|jgi:site-specific recombinase XerD|nr:site-specific integrase [Bacteroidales bacterium]
MKNDFAKYLTSFFQEYLSGERGVSPNTIRSYSNTFTLLLNYMDDIKHLKADRLSLEHITKKTVLNFLDWLQNSRKCGNTTRNQRLAALHSFSKYMQYEDVQHLEQWQEILSIKIRKTEKKSVNYLTVEGIKLILEQIPTNTKSGRRDLALLALLYDSGARVQELIDLTPASLHLNKPCYVTLFGKGCKKRIVPLQDKQILLLQKYMLENGLDKDSRNLCPLFANNRGEKLTNAGITYILNQYVNNARKINPELIPDKISPHCLRHSKAMHLLQAGVNLVYIRDILVSYF